MRGLTALEVFPNIFFTFIPFKIFEYKELLKGVKFSKDDIVLDIGCGNGLQTALLAKNCAKVIGIDVSEKDITFAKTYLCHNRNINVELLNVRLEDAKFVNETFDKIFSICVIEHIDNYREVLKESYRILKINGQMIFSVDSLENIEDKGLIEEHKKIYSVVKYFRIKELKEILTEIGFSKIDIYPIFRSNYAKKKFIRGIKNNFKYGYLRSILSYFLLLYKEKTCPNIDKGLFIVAKCYK